jgi:hypothetical protein
MAQTTRDASFGLVFLVVTFLGHRRHRRRRRGVVVDVDVPM